MDPPCFPWRWTKIDCPHQGSWCSMVCSSPYVRPFLLNVECSGYGWWKHYGSYGSSRQTQFCDVHNISPMFHTKVKNKASCNFWMGNSEWCFLRTRKLLPFFGYGSHVFRWLFHICVYFHPYLGKMSKLAEFFQDELKSRTSSSMTKRQKCRAEELRLATSSLRSYRIFQRARWSVAWHCEWWMLQKFPRISDDVQICLKALFGFHDFEDGSISVPWWFLGTPNKSSSLMPSKPSKKNPLSWLVRFKDMYSPEKPNGWNLKMDGWKTIPGFLWGLGLFSGANCCLC